ncbi:MAG TPA: TIGR03751 family conjugal transfer lipoprotein [Rhodospirillales bacterium]|nr:TIGR03751 family conjugal transfer lipoprotein [Rhodospirillales bacterium]
MVCRRTAAALISISLLAGACTSKDEVLPQDGPRMLDIYYGHFNGSGRPPSPEGEDAEAGAQAGSKRHDRAQAIGVARDTLAARGEEVDADLAAYTRTVRSETSALFPRLPNPEIVLYVFPHLAGGERLPVPGYSTVFPLYPRTEYALPGETLLPRPPVDPQDRSLDPPSRRERRIAGRGQDDGR